ncbi:MAG: hypothetical protein ACD_75C00482G0004 [uncultured bacterium]|nr:MAG: hypothetical protein ACD_75C00482G0004 [uncultured bacterium]
MAVGVVHVLEIVYVDDDQREVLPVAPGAEEFRFEYLCEVAPVEEVGQVIDVGESL